MAEVVATSEEKVMVPKPGLYKGGLLKSLMTWAIPLSILQNYPVTQLLHFVSPTPTHPYFIGLFNTGITLAPGATPPPSQGALIHINDHHVFWKCSLSVGTATFIP